MVGCPTPEDLRRYLAGGEALDLAELRRIEAHVETCEVCLGVLDRLTAEEVPSGTMLPDLGPSGYHVLKRLGAGTFGEVWLAQDLNLPRVVALKTLRVPSAPDQRARALEALRNDARLLVEVSHPNILQVYAWIQAGEAPYLVLQYVAGGSLADRLKAEGALDWQRAARYIADVGEGLLETHARGIVHRDVKPANILWDPRRDEALLTDFGVAARLADPGTVAGSPLYMAPEAFDGRVSPALDVYGLASTLFHLTTGSAPFPGPQIADLRLQIARGLPDPDPRCRDLPEPLERIIRAGLAAEPERRPDLRAFVAALRGTLNQLLADTLTLLPAGGRHLAPVDLRLSVSRRVGQGTYQPVAATPPPSSRGTRDMKKVPRPPERVRLRTGDRVRIEVVADRAGHITVFNVGPTGNLNLLHPDELPAVSAPLVEAHWPLQIHEVELIAPPGRERLVAIWSRGPLPLQPEQLHSLVERVEIPVSRPYRATRDMRRVQGSVQQLRPEDWHAAILELDHGPQSTASEGRG
jgi:serine/threonine protein kinase